MNTTTIGTYSICGGAVVVPAVWHGVVPPVPKCSRCGAVACEDHGPVIPMKKADVHVDRIWSGSVPDKIEW